MSDFTKNGSFEFANSKNYILSIQVCLDGFSFLISDPNEKNIVAQKSSPLKISNENVLTRRLKEWLESEEVLKYNYNHVRIFIYTENFTLIPEEYLCREKQRNFSPILFDKKQSVNFFENKIESLDAILLFPVSQDVLYVLNQFFNKGFEIIHPLKSLIEFKNETDKRNLSVILSTKNFFYLTVFGNNKLLLANSFQSPHLSDLVYNIINTYQKLKISRNDTKLIISSAIEQNFEIKILLKPYFENISQIEIDDLIGVPVDFES